MPNGKPTPTVDPDKDKVDSTAAAAARVKANQEAAAADLAQRREAGPYQGDEFDENKHDLVGDEAEADARREEAEELSPAQQAAKKAFIREVAEAVPHVRSVHGTHNAAMAGLQTDASGSYTPPKNPAHTVHAV